VGAKDRACDQEITEHRVNKSRVLEDMKQAFQYVETKRHSNSETLWTILNAVLLVSPKWGSAGRVLSSLNLG